MFQNFSNKSAHATMQQCQGTAAARYGPVSVGKQY